MLLCKHLQNRILKIPNSTHFFPFENNKLIFLMNGSVKFSYFPVEIILKRNILCQKRKSHLNLISSTGLLGLGQRENNEENYGSIEVTTLMPKLQTRCIIAHGCIYSPRTKLSYAGAILCYLRLRSHDAGTF